MGTACMALKGIQSAAKGNPIKGVAKSDYYSTVNSISKLHSVPFNI
ncbi:MAG: hypothetical protein QXJ22_02765 [Ignisphaera sp.]